MPAVLARFVTTVVVLTLAAVAAHATEDRYPATAQQDFDATNPEFDRNRKDDNLGLGMVIVDRRFEGPAADKVNENLPAMLDKYYELRGWDKATGKPTPDKLRELGLEEYIADIWGK